MKVFTTRSVDYLNKPGHDFWKRRCWWVIQMYFFGTLSTTNCLLSSSFGLKRSHTSRFLHGLTVRIASMFNVIYFLFRRKRTSSGRSARWPTAKCCGGLWCRPPSCCQSASGRWNDLKTSSLPRSWSDDDLWPLHPRPDDFIASPATTVPVCKLYAAGNVSRIYDMI